jgi:hypothetical protein
MVPMTWVMGAGSDVMKRGAAALVGGVLRPLLLELLVCAAIREIWRWDFGLKLELGENAGYDSGELVGPRTQGG